MSDEWGYEKPKSALHDRLAIFFCGGLEVIFSRLAAFKSAAEPNFLFLAAAGG